MRTPGSAQSTSCFILNRPAGGWVLPLILRNYCRNHGYKVCHEPAGCLRDSLTPRAWKGRNDLFLPTNKSRNTATLFRSKAVFLASAEFLLSLLMCIFEMQEKQWVWMWWWRMQSPAVGERGLFSSFTSLQLPALSHPASWPWPFLVGKTSSWFKKGKQLKSALGQK